MIRFIAAIAVIAMSSAVLAQAPTRIRGTLDRVDGNMLTVKARSGEVMKVKVPDNVLVIGIAKASMADIGNAKYIGTTTVGQRDGPSGPCARGPPPRSPSSPWGPWRRPSCGRPRRLA